ncbi:MAG TPA: DUF6210 family protein [Terracidiphilus sp.]|nr:DUF6210 family protein [Terracidiphilus sp.]
MGYLEEQNELNDRVKWGEVRVVEIDPDGTLPEEWMAAVIRHPSGVVYIHQSNGLACQQRMVEGCLVMLGGTSFDVDKAPTRSRELTAAFHEGNACRWEWAGERIPRNRIEQLSKLVRQIGFWSYEHGLGHLELDLARRDEIAEAWIPVLTPDGPGVLIYQNCD